MVVCEVSSPGWFDETFFPELAKTACFDDLNRGGQSVDVDLHQGCIYTYHMSDVWPPHPSEMKLAVPWLVVVRLGLHLVQ